MVDWYEGIESGIRNVVRLLRDNGFNTTCSCHHEMNVQVELGNNLDEAERLARFLQEHGYSKFELQAILYASPQGMWTRRATVWIGWWPECDECPGVKREEPSEQVDTVR